MIKTIYQDTSTEHDLQIKRVIEQIIEETVDNIEETHEQMWKITEERMESEA